MKIVIDLPETLKKIADEEDIKTFSHLMWSAIIMDAIRNGTPLPKGHGRLIDEQHIIDRFKPVEKFEYWRIGLDGLINVLSDEPTIIEADRGE